LSEGYDRLAEDHENARYLSEELEMIDGLNVRKHWTQSNMVWADLARDHLRALGEFARARGVLISTSRNYIRFVVHRDVSREDIDKVSCIVKD